MAVRYFLTAEGFQHASRHFDPVNHFDVIGVPRSATGEQVRSAYLRALRRLRSGTFERWRMNLSGRSELNLAEAFAVLIDADQRDAYERWLDSLETRCVSPGH